MKPAALPEHGRGGFLWTEVGKNFPVSVTVREQLPGFITGCPRDPACRLVVRRYCNPLFLLSCLLTDSPDLRSKDVHVNSFIGILNPDVTAPTKTPMLREGFKLSDPHA